ncbi:hypothetical protein EI94DRAFT_1782975 [Lactarius quietus]|nr:hypothetical protein EI94DRAFT_1782975 [Lactarius quietus]
MPITIEMGIDTGARKDACAYSGKGGSSHQPSVTSQETVEGHATLVYVREARGYYVCHANVEASSRVAMRTLAEPFCQKKPEKGDKMANCPSFTFKHTLSPAKSSQARKMVTLFLVDIGDAWEVVKACVQHTNYRLQHERLFRCPADHRGNKESGGEASIRSRPEKGTQQRVRLVKIYGRTKRGT